MAGGELFMDHSAMDRLRDASAGKPGDRVPLFPMIAGRAAANFSDISEPILARCPDLMASMISPASFRPFYPDFGMRGPPATSIENFAARVKAAEKYGRGPESGE